MFAPLNVGYISAYCGKIFGKSVDISLHKDADSLFAALAAKRHDIVGLSYYHWNANLNRVVSRQIRQRYGQDVLICMGGPSIDVTGEEQQDVLARFPDVQALVINEGEAGFANIVRSVLSSSVARCLDHPIEGVSFMQEGRLVQGKDIGLSTNLEELVSPYLSGTLDRFLDASFLPIIQTARLCPYTCTFCASGRNTGKLRGFPLEVVKDEITYVARKFQDRPHILMNLADDNFGILKRDVEIARHIRKTSDEIGYPEGLRFYSDKNFGETSMAVVEILGDLNKFGANFSLQTQTPGSLDRIRRKNMTVERLDESIAWARQRGLPTSTELIFGLPGETFKSFIDQLSGAIDRGFDAVNCLNLIILDGTEMARSSFRKDFQYTPKYRVNGSNYGLVNGEFSIELEEIVTASDTFTYAEFVTMRKLMFMFYAIFTLGFYRWFFMAVKQAGIPLVDFLIRFTSPPEPASWSPGYARFIADLNASIDGEFSDTAEQAVATAKAEFEAHGATDGFSPKLNVFYGSRMAFMERAWTRDVLFRHVTEGYGGLVGAAQMEAIRTALEVCDRERIDLRNPQVPPGFTSRFDIVAWRRSGFKGCLSDYDRGEVAIAFGLSERSEKKVRNFNDEFAARPDNDYYFLAQEVISPRSDLLLDVTTTKAS